MKLSPSQSGRSMVEIIGVLAVIGVLSIGGIAGYSYGMDKYRANETVNDIMLRSIDLINQLSANKTPILSEWKTEKTIYPIDVLRNDSLGQYAIVAENIPSRVCKMIGDTLKEHADIYVGSDALEAETDDTDPCEESEQNTMEFYFNAISCDPACGEDEYCENGVCFKNGLPDFSMADCGRIGNACTTENGLSGFCTKDGCIPLDGCTSNEECENNEYCATTNYLNAEIRFPDNSRGICQKINFMRYIINNEVYYISKISLNWWNAEWACKKIGKEHLEVFDYYKNYNTNQEEEKIPSDLSIALSNVIGKTYVWTKTELNSQHHHTPLIGTSTWEIDRNLNSHERVAVCK